MKEVKQIFIFLLLFLGVGCSSDELIKTEPARILSPTDDITIEIKTSRTYNESLPLEGAITRSSDPFTEIRDVESSESVVLPELQPPYFY